MAKKQLFAVLISFFFFNHILAQEDYVKSADVGISQTGQYFPQLAGKRLALVVNQSSEFLAGKHLVDSLRKAGFIINKIFAPEHGFRGNADAGEKLDASIDSLTQVPIISLYGAHYKPSAKDLEDIDIVIFDIQDVGVRFYTYLSTLHYVMEACAENGKKLILLDRPNPNAFYIDGPVLEDRLHSFVGMHPVPIVYGMTIGEYAQMINGEGWLLGSLQCHLQVVKISNYTHKKRYKLPIKPSPNLPNELSILLYPTLCLYEGTEISVARGTYFPFQAIGHPNYPESKFTFTPTSIEGMSKEPPYKDKLCYGVDFRQSNIEALYAEGKVDISKIIEVYNKMVNKKYFFNSFFDRLVGVGALKIQIIQGRSEEEIRESWKEGLNNFKQIRNKYLLYP